MIKCALQYGDQMRFAVWGRFPDRIGIWKSGFLRRGENRSTRRKTSRGKDKNHQQTQPTYDAGSRNRTRATLVGGECSQHCTIHDPLSENTSLKNAKLATNPSLIWAYLRRALPLVPEIWEDFGGIIFREAYIRN